MKTSLTLLLSFVSILGNSVLPGQDIKLRSNDLVIVQISGVPAEEQAQVEKSYPINDRGQIRLPYIDALTAVGLSPDTLAQKIEMAYKKGGIYTQPRVTVTTPEENRVVRRITVMGEVNRPGIQEYQRDMTILEAIAQAGNPSQFGDMKKVKLIRAGKTYVINLQNVSEDTDKDIRLEPGDRIIVP